MKKVLRPIPASALMSATGPTPIPDEEGIETCDGVRTGEGQDVRHPYLMKKVLRQILAMGPVVT